MTRVLFCVLDWGLGHATRSIPIIQALLAKGCTVDLASSGRAAILLQEEFPQLKCFLLPAYDIRYHFNDGALNIAVQGPKILLAIMREHRIVRSLYIRHGYQIIISDNRYGCHHQGATNVMITHQISPHAPNGVYRKIASMMINKWLSPFNHVWIPDLPGQNSISKELSYSPNIPTRYIGILSRFERVQNKFGHRLLAIISGPEPQRKILEEKLCVHLEELGYPYRVIRGVTEGSQVWRKISDRGQIVDYLTAQSLQQEVNESHIVICRSGYSSIMDLVKLQKKSVLIATPGQYEQEYLAKNLDRYTFLEPAKQDPLDLREALEKLQNTTLSTSWNLENLLDPALNDLLAIE